jgi:hypothetical protein
MLEWREFGLLSIEPRKGAPRDESRMNPEDRAKTLNAWQASARYWDRVSCATRRIENEL